MMSSVTESKRLAMSIAPDSFHRRREIFAQEAFTRFDVTITEFDAEKCALPTHSVDRETRIGTSKKSTSRDKEEIESLS